MKERRIDPRLLCAELVELVWTDQRGFQQRRIANLEDISLCGACVQVESPMPCGTAVSMHYGDGQLSGIVRYCLYQGIGYFLGVEFDEDSRWSPKHFKPQHLLDSRQLVKAAARRSRSTTQVQCASSRI
jgi:ribulose bisphosphate carboxylase small subunit